MFNAQPSGTGTVYDNRDTKNIKVSQELPTSGWEKDADRVLSVERHSGQDGHCSQCDTRDSNQTTDRSPDDARGGGECGGELR